jgi:hypothetical protein
LNKKAFRLFFRQALFQGVQQEEIFMRTLKTNELSFVSGGRGGGGAGGDRGQGNSSSASASAGNGNPGTSTSAKNSNPSNRNTAGL